MAQSALDETRRSNGANRRQSRAPSEPSYPTADQSNSALLQSYGSDPTGTGDRKLSRPERERARGGAANSTPATPLFNQPKPGQGQMGSGRSQRSAISAGNTPAQFTPIPHNVMRAEVDRYERVTGNSYQPDAQPAPSRPSSPQPQAPQTQSAINMPNSPVAANQIPWWMGGESSSLQPSSTPGNTPATGSVPPAAPAPAADGGAGGGTIYSGTGPDGSMKFSDSPFPGSQVYTAGAGGQGGVGPGRDDLARANLFESIDQRTADGFARTQSAMEQAARPQRGPQRMQMDPRVQQMGSALSEISQMIQSGRGPNGRPLTADGMSALIGRANALDKGINDLYGVDAGVYSDQLNYQNRLDERALANQGQLANTALGGQYQLADTDAQGVRERNLAQAAAWTDGIGLDSLPEVQMPDPDDDPKGYAKAQRASEISNYYLAENNQNVTAAREAMKATIRDAGLSAYSLSQLGEQDGAILDENPNLMFVLAGLEHLDARLSLVKQNRENLVGQNREGFAEGGLVGSMQSGLPAEMMGSAGPGGAPTPELGSPPGMDITAIQNYQKYVDMANQMGLDPVSFEEFSKMASPQQAPGGGMAQMPGMPEMQPNAAATQQVFGMAEGGMVPDLGAIGGMMGNQVDGKMVTDPDPNAPTDSIPAMIDGQQPAALDSGEYVIPADVVMYYGTEKLSKLIEKARSPVGQQSPQGAQDV